MKYRFTKKCAALSARELWRFIQNGLAHDVIIKSIKDKKPYTVKSVSDTAISFSAATRNNGEPEVIPYEDFETVISRLKKMGEFNTSTAKECFKQTRIYKKRSPFFALLYSGRVIEGV